MSSVAQVVGIDAHKDSFTFVALGNGVKAGEGCLPNNPCGYQALLKQVQQVAEGYSPVFAVENARGYALTLSCYLLDQGQTLYDLPATAVAGLRKRRNRAKNDVEDARQAARVLLEDPTFAQRSPLRLNPELLQIQSLERTRETLVRQRVALTQQLEALKAQPYAPVAAGDSLRVIQKVVGEQIEALEQALQVLMKPYQGLLEQPGIGLVTAAVLLGETQDLGRFRSEAAFASYAGIAPRDHSSGRSNRVKVNPGGNRRLNRAIELITWNRLRVHEPTRTYKNKKRSQGMAARQATRAAKRQVCRAVFRALRELLT